MTNRYVAIVMALTFAAAIAAAVAVFYLVWQETVEVEMIPGTEENQMTRADIMNLAQAFTSLQPLVKDGKLPEEEAHRLLGRLLWAIHASNGTPKFDEQKFCDFTLGKFGRVASQMFPSRL